VLEVNLPPHYTILTDESILDESELSEDEKPILVELGKTRTGLRGIWTFNIVAMLFAQAIFDFHMG
jgi:hypothetical protein